VKVAGVYIRRNESRAVVLDERGSLLFRDVAPGANYHSVGSDGILSMIEGLFRECGVKDIDCMCIGVAGCDREEDMNDLRTKLLASGIKDCIVYNNGVIALVGASGRSLGEENAVMVEADTGAVVIGASTGGEVIRAGGWGNIIGDEGGSFDMGRKLLLHETRDHDRIEDGPLDEEVMRFLALDDFSELIALYDLADPVRYVASLFPLVCDLVGRDERIDRMLDEGAAALASLVKVIPRRVEMNGEIMLYEEGRVFGCEHYRKNFEARLDGFTVRGIRHEPEIGAAMLAFEKVTGVFREFE
jgi:N-acetylglucosamine kinase-like BadF-type ATPase